MEEKEIENRNEKDSTPKESRKTVMIDMTEGSPLGLLIRFAIPLLIGNLFQQVYNLVDSIIVGKLVGSQALAAVGASGSISFLFFALCNGVGSGGGIITSQMFGRKDVKQVKKCISNTAYIMLLFSVVVGTVAFFLAKPLLILLKTPDDIFPDSIAYLRVMCIGIIFVALYNFASSMLRSLGDSITPLCFLIGSTILNGVLDFVFVYYFHMGVLGAAVATMISQLIAGTSCLIYAAKTNPFFKLSKEDMQYDRSICNSIIKIGVPLSLQFSLIAISTMALQRVVNSFGSVTVAAFTAISRIEQVIHQPYQTLSASLSTYTGQNYGARNKKRILKGYHTGMLIMVVFTVIMLPLMQLFGDNIMRIFVNDAEVIAMGATAIKISSLFYVFLGMIYAIRGVLNGLSDSFFAMLNGVVEVVGRFTVPIWLTSIASIGLWGIWWSVGIVWFLSGFTAWLRYIYKIKRFQI